MTAYKRGDVCLVLYPQADLRTFKRRPVVLVQRDRLDSGIPQFVAATISGNMARAGHRSRVVLRRASPEGRRAGVRRDSVVMTDNLATIRADEIDRKIGALADRDGLDGALRHTLDLT